MHRSHLAAAYHNKVRFFSLDHDDLWGYSSNPLNLTSRPTSTRTETKTSLLSGISRVLPGVGSGPDHRPGPRHREAGAKSEPRIPGKLCKRTRHSARNAIMNKISARVRVAEPKIVASAPSGPDPCYHQRHGNHKPITKALLDYWP